MEVSRSRFGADRMSKVEKTLQFYETVIYLLSSQLNGRKKCVIRRLPSELFRILFEFLEKNKIDLDLMQ